MIIVTFILGIAVLFLLLFLLIKWLMSSSSNIRKYTLTCLLLVSLFVNAFFLVYFGLSDCHIGGDGQHEVSPDNLYKAYAFSLRPLVGSHQEYYVFTIESQSGQRMKTVRIDPENTNKTINFRQIPQIIHWSADSSEVEFHIPDYRLIMTVDNTE